MSDVQRIEQMADLSTIGGGAIAEKFAAELKAVLANIKDPNTESDAKRKITIEFVFKPDSDRERIFTAISAHSTLAATRPTGDVLYLGKQDGELVATVMQGQDPRQGVLEIVPPAKQVKGASND